MQKLPNLSYLWQEFFVETPVINGLDTWTIVFIARDANDVLVSLADPITEAKAEVFVEHVTDADLKLFVNHYKSRFNEQLDWRFGLFRPEVNQVLTEYPDWVTFYHTWLNDDPQLIQANMPLLFDYPSEDEYRAMQLKGANYAGYRRLLVIIYQYRKQVFHRIFIKGVDNDQYTAIKSQITRLYESTLPSIIQKS